MKGCYHRIQREPCLVARPTASAEGSPLLFPVLARWFPLFWPRALARWRYGNPREATPNEFQEKRREKQANGEGREGILSRAAFNGVDHRPHLGL